jgi:hypothetical protein
MHICYTANIAGKLRDSTVCSCSSYSRSVSFTKTCCATLPRMPRQQCCHNIIGISHKQSLSFPKYLALFTRCSKAIPTLWHFYEFNFLPTVPPKPTQHPAQLYTFHSTLGQLCTHHFILLFNTTLPPTICFLRHTNGRSNCFAACAPRPFRHHQSYHKLPLRRRRSP